MAKPKRRSRTDRASERGVAAHRCLQQRTVAAIHQVQDKTANWDADALRGSGVPVLPDCKRVFIVRNTICDRSTICWSMIEQSTITCSRCGMPPSSRCTRMLQFVYDWQAVRAVEAEADDC